MGRPRVEVDTSSSRWDDKKVAKWSRDVMMLSLRQQFRDILGSSFSNCFMFFLFLFISLFRFRSTRRWTTLKFSICGEVHRGRGGIDGTVFFDNLQFINSCECDVLRSCCVRVAPSSRHFHPSEPRNRKRSCKNFFPPDRR